MANQTAQEKIAEIKAKAAAEVAKLTADALAELHDKRKAAEAVLQGINDAIEELSGKPARGKRGGGRATTSGREVSAAELKKALKDAGGAEGNSRKLATALGAKSSDVVATARNNEKDFKTRSKGPQVYISLK